MVKRPHSKKSTLSRKSVFARKSTLPSMPKEIPSTKYIFAILTGLLILAVIITLRYSSETVIETTTTTAPSLTTTTTSPTPPMPPTPTAPVGLTGKLMVALKDEEHKIAGGTVIKSMNFTVAKIEVLIEGGEWTELDIEPKTLDLLDYTDNVAVVAEADLEEGTYERLKLGLSDGEISITNEFLYIYKPKRYDMIVPEETVVEHTFNIVADETITLILDFDVENSVTRTGIEYTLDPVITVTEELGVPDNAVTL